MSAGSRVSKKIFPHKSFLRGKIFDFFTFKFLCGNIYLSMYTFLYGLGRIFSLVNPFKHWENQKLSVAKIYH